jgi:hypothetical protein
MKFHHLPLLTAFLICVGACTSGAKTIECFRLPSDVRVWLKKGTASDWGLVLTREGAPLLANPKPLHIEIFDGGAVAASLESGYQSFENERGSWIARGLVEYKGATFHVTDRWREEGRILTVDRMVSVSGSLPGGFMSGITLSPHQPATRDSVKLFAPGMIYGGTDNLTAGAIGGSDVKDFIRIREDRLPAPMIGAWFENGLSLTFLNTKPDGSTVKADSQDMEAKPLIHEGLRFGALGADFDQERPSFGYWFPGSEGGVIYKGQTYPHGQMKKWLRRYHPVRDGFEQAYQVSFRIASTPSFADYYTDAWRWAWKTLRPQVVRQDIAAVRTSLLAQLSGMVLTRNGVTGLQSLAHADGEGDGTRSFGFNIRMGFVGRSIEAANYLLADSLREGNPHRETYRQQGEAIIRTFTALNMSPPQAEGFMNGKPFAKKRVFLRSMADGHRELLKCVIREQAAGHAHDDWVAWSRSFADWLLPQQSEAGGFPRAWEAGTGKVLDPSPHSSYNAIVFLLLLDQLTGDERYGAAAVRAAEFCWKTSHSRGVFIGGTSDNPDVIDKEAGTLSLEAYLALHRHTSDAKWVERARMAANFAETWIYIWNVPMPADVPDEELHWEKGVSTVGMQLIASGHSLADQNMAYDADEFAELFLRTGDRHYRDVSMILLHNTKSMLALPGRRYDLRGPGWMQEHWSIAPERGVGMNRVWVGWVSTSQLNGIIELEELDRDLFLEMIR